MDRPLRVLIVEDSLTMGEFLLQSLQLTDGRLTAEHCTSLAAAVSRVVEGGVDVMLLDLMLPDAADVEAVEAIQQLAPELPIVVLSSLGPEIEERVLKAGAQEYLDKGDHHSPQELTYAMRRAVIRNEVEQKYYKAWAGLDSTARAVEEVSKLDEKYQAVRDEVVSSLEKGKK